MGHPLRRGAEWLLTILLVLLAVGSVTRVLTKGLGDRAIDLHSYWYSGHFLWQRADPYRAWAEGTELDAPVYHIGGEVLSAGSVPRNGWGAAPANTAPVLLLLAPLSLLSWDAAVWSWAVLNLGFAVLIVWGLAKIGRFLPLSRRGLLVLSLLLAMIATREVIEYGQTSMLILAAMVLALVCGPRHRYLAGVCLGIAMSKYSLAFPVFLLFAHKRWYSALVASLLIQLAGVLGVAIIGHSAPHEIIITYVRMMLAHTDLPGMHLSAGLLRPMGMFRQWGIVAGSVFLALVLIRWYRIHDGRDSRWQTALTSQDMGLLLSVIIWNLLVFYHRRYDHVAMILFFGYLGLLAGAPLQTHLSSRQHVGLWVVILSLSVVWIAPLYLLTSEPAYLVLYNLSTLSALAMTLWLLFRVQAPAGEASHDRVAM